MNNLQSMLGSILSLFLFLSPSAFRFQRSSIPLYTVLMSLLAYTTRKPWPAALIYSLYIALQSLVMHPTSWSTFFYRVIPIYVLIGFSSYVFATKAGAKFLLNRRYHTTVAYIYTLYLLIEVLYGLTSHPVLDQLLLSIREVVVGSYDSTNFRNMSILGFFQEQSFLPYFVLYLSCTFRFLGIRFTILPILLVFVFHRSATFLLLAPFILLLLLPRLRLGFGFLLFAVSLILLMSISPHLSRLLFFAEGDIDESVLSRLVTIFSAFTALIKYPFGVGSGAYTSYVVDLLSPYSHTMLGSLFDQSIRDGWLHYKIFESQRLSYTSQYFGLIVEYGWPFLVLSLYFITRKVVQALDSDYSYYRLVAMIASIFSFCLSMPILFPYAYIAFGYASHKGTYETRKFSGTAPAHARICI